MNPKKNFYCAVLAIFCAACSAETDDSEENQQAVLEAIESKAFHAQDLVELVSPAYFETSPRLARVDLERVENPLVPLWAGLIRAGYLKIGSRTIGNTTSGVPSIAVWLRDPPPANTKPRSPVQQLWGLTSGVTKGDLPTQPLKVCSGSNSERNLCCLQNPYPKCVQDYRWSWCSQDICKGAQMAGAGLSGALLLSIELAAYSALVPESEVFASKGDEVFFVWPYIRVVDEKRFALRTEITGDLIDRLVVSSSHFSSTIDRLNSLPPKESKIVCEKTGTDFISFELKSREEHNVMVFGQGRPTQAHTPKELAENSSVSLYIESTPDRTKLAVLSTISAPVGADDDFINFARIALDEPSRPFHCMPSMTMKQLHDTRSLLNNREGANFLFGLAYLTAFWREQYGK